MKTPRKPQSGAVGRKKARIRQAMGLPPGTPIRIANASPVEVPAEAPGLPDMGSFAALVREGRDAASMYGEALDFQREAMRRSITASGTEAAALERAARIAAGLVKGADLKKQLDERDAVIRKMAEDIEELEERVSESTRPRLPDALQERSPDHRRAGAKAEH